MSSNHPWRTPNHDFSCEPNCPKRKPGCQDHCEKHQRELAEHLRKKRILDEKKHIDGYASKLIYENRDAEAKRVKRPKPAANFYN